jgi:hypothetical protein
MELLFYKSSTLIESLSQFPVLATSPIKWQHLKLNGTLRIDAIRSHNR